jgi:hypothetical protein
MQITWVELYNTQLPFFFLWILTSFVILCHRIWDLSLEKDEEEEAEFKARTKEQVNAPEDLPPQLLFIHQVIWITLVNILNTFGKTYTQLSRTYLMT